MILENDDYYNCVWEMIDSGRQFGKWEIDFLEEMSLQAFYTEPEKVKIMEIYNER